MGKNEKRNNNHTQKVRDKKKDYVKETKNKNKLLCNLKN